MSRINLVLASLIVIGLMTGCGGSGSGSGKVSGEIYSTEIFSVLVPKGWKAFPYYQAGTETPRQNMVAVHKGAKEPNDMSETPGIVINYFPDAKTVMTPRKSLYEDTADMEPFTSGKYTWEGFTGVNNMITRKMPVAVFWTTNAAELFQVVVWLENGGKKIALDNADVQAIIAGISFPK